MFVKVVAVAPTMVRRDRRIQTRRARPPHAPGLPPWQPACPRQAPDCHRPRPHTQISIRRPTAACGLPRVTAHRPSSRPDAQPAAHPERQPGQPACLSRSVIKIPERHATHKVLTWAGQARRRATADCRVQPAHPCWQCQPTERCSVRLQGVLSDYTVTIGRKRPNIHPPVMMLSLARVSLYSAPTHPSIRNVVPAAIAKYSESKVAETNTITAHDAVHALR